MCIRDSPPTVAIEQRTSQGGRKSTVGTVTEIYHFLRLLFVKLGSQFCPQCNLAIQPQSPAEILVKLFKDYRDKWVSFLAPVVMGRKGYYTELAQWAQKKGFEKIYVDNQLVSASHWPRLDRFKEHNIELYIGNCYLVPEQETQIQQLLTTTLNIGKGQIYLVIHPSRHKQILTKLASKNKIFFSTQRACPRCHRSFPPLDPRLFSFNSKENADDFIQWLRKIKSQKEVRLFKASALVSGVIGLVPYAWEGIEVFKQYWNTIHTVSYTHLTLPTN